VSVSFNKLERSGSKFVRKFLKQASPVKGILKGSKPEEISTKKEPELQQLAHISDESTVRTALDV
jgi:hypothetical protein